MIAKHLQGDAGMRYSFDLSTPKGEIAIKLSAIGRHNVANALAASAVVLALSIPLEKIQAGLGSVSLVL